MKAWVNFYPTGLHGHIGNAYRTRALADQFAHPSRLACKAVEFEPGEGLDFLDEPERQHWTREAMTRSQG